MNPRSMNSFLLASFAGAIVVCGSPVARAVSLSAETVDISQVPPYTSLVKLGHMVNGRTIMISIAVGGSFRVSCPSPNTGTIEGANYRSQTNIPPNVLSVEVPAGWLPAQRELPGFNNVPDGTALSCTYFWTASAKEAMYTLGAGGASMPVGGEGDSKADSRVFEMYKPGSGSKDNGGCMH